MKKESLSLITVKTLLAVIIFAGIGTIIIGGGYIIGEYSKNGTANKITKPVDQETENCAKEGESVGSCVGCKKCCQGLQPMDYLKYNSECVNSPMPGGGVCSNCGNGICDEKNNEDECNCPEDCGEIKIPDWAIYESEKLGIIFRHQNWWVESRSEKDFENIIIEQNNTIKSTSLQGSSITVFEKSKDETIEEAIRNIIKKEGVDLKDCEISFNKQNTLEDDENVIGRISLKENYEPSDDELMAKIEKVNSLEELKIICETTPECEWAKQILIEEKTKIKCSQYAKCFGYKCGSNFIYQPNNSEEKFIYLKSMANTPCFWEFNSIKILKDQSDTSDWQTYRNEEFGFEVKYPEGWTFRDQHTGTLLLKPTSDNLSHAHFLIDAIGHAVDSPSIKKEFEKIIFAGRDAKEFNLIEKKFILREIRILEIDGKWTKDNNILYYVENDKKDLIPILNQIFSTFKFIEK